MYFLNKNNENIFPGREQSFMKKRESKRVSGNVLHRNRKALFFTIKIKTAGSLRNIIGNIFIWYQ